MVLEIQQTSDITYRVFDWNRTDKDGNSRELHTDLAVDAMDFHRRDDLDITYVELDSFVIYVCVDGSADMVWDGGREKIAKGETVLIPAEMDEITLEGKARIIEVYIPGKEE